MTDEFYLDPDGASRAAGALRDSGNRLEKSFNALKAVCDHNDQCWGTDEIGAAFANKYVPTATEITVFGATDPKAIVESANNTDKNIDTFEDLDHEAAVRLDRTPPEES
ncbi:hypothetical protein [Amycolatopsis sp. EV170708-02-1]|uniref:hypothetical protein n=1 Tax=Amycolatopsis sp. EV170708-02-1 TaxID=2919322 RepID=UPI001F0CA9BC|nr:hypothetical protein [Amycolatopsis sp. EV170708-02-1]UMP06960.1 hypothetical protein MJQ72_20045 [Amycolatopsis sp. EV170708-02-1]